MLPRGGGAQQFCAWSISDIKYVIVQKIQTKCMYQCWFIDADTDYRWRNDGGVNLCKRIVGCIENNMNMNLRNLLYRTMCLHAKL